MAGKGKGNGIKAQMVDTASVMDLARLACRVENPFVYAVKEGTGYSLLLPAERAGKVLLVFRARSEAIARYGSYSRFEPESFKLHTSARDLDLQSQKAHIIELGGSPFSATSQKPDVPLIRVMDHTDLVREQVYRSVEEQATQVIYSFTEKGKRVVGVLAQADHDTQVFAYALVPEAGESGFFRYSYAQDSVTMEKGVARTSDMYVPIINLKQKFTFFKLPE